MWKVQLLWSLGVLLAHRLHCTCRNVACIYKQSSAEYTDMPEGNARASSLYVAVSQSARLMRWQTTVLANNMENVDAAGCFRKLAFWEHWDSSAYRSHADVKKSRTYCRKP